MTYKLLYFISILSAFLFWTGCGDQLDLPEPQLGAPVFEVSATIGGEAVFWQAGIDDYYMFTNYEQDDDGVYTFSGRLAQDDCEMDCEGSLGFFFRDEEARTTGESFIPLSYLANHDFSFSPIVDSLEVNYTVQFTNYSIGVNPVAGFFFWEFEGINLPSEEFEPEIEYEEGGEYNVCMTVSSATCAQVQCQEIQLGGEENCYAILNYIPDSSGQHFLSALPFNSTPAVAYQWSDGSTSQQIALSPNIMGPQCVTITDAEGCTAEACAIVAYDQGLGNYDICYVGFSYATTADTLLVQQNPLQLGTVAIAYKAPDGIVYRSDLAPDEGQGQLDILSVEPFENNENGLPTQKLEITFSATLYDNSGNSLLLENGAAVIALAYPGQ